MTDAIDEDDELLGLKPALPAPYVEDRDVAPSYGPAMSACLEKERRFVLIRLQPDMSDAEAARQAGYGSPDGNSSPNTMARIAYRLTHENSRVAAALQEVAAIAVRDLATDSLNALTRILKNDWHKDQAKVALALMERIAPTTQKIDVTHTHVLDHETEALNQLRSLRALGVARDKLVEVFGAFGLDRLEARLEPEPIDAEWSEVERDTGE